MSSSKKQEKLSLNIIFLPKSAQQASGLKETSSHPFSAPSLHPHNPIKPKHRPNIPQHINPLHRKPLPPIPILNSKPLEHRIRTCRGAILTKTQGVRILQRAPSSTDEVGQVVCATGILVYHILVALCISFFAIRGQSDDFQFTSYGLIARRGDKLNTR